MMLTGLITESPSLRYTTPRFVRDSSKYWHKPRISRDEGNCKFKCIVSYNNNVIIKSLILFMVICTIIALKGSTTASRTAVDLNLLILLKRSLKAIVGNEANIARKSILRISKLLLVHCIGDTVLLSNSAALTASPPLVSCYKAFANAVDLPRFVGTTTVISAVLES